MTGKLTVDEHILLATYLRNIRKEIAAIRNLTAGRGLITRVGQRVYAADRKLGELTSALDDVMFRDHQDDPRTRQDVYYGPSAPDVAK